MEHWLCRKTFTKSSWTTSTRATRCKTARIVIVGQGNASSWKSLNATASGREKPGPIAKMSREISAWRMMTTRRTPSWSDSPLRVGKQSRESFFTSNMPTQPTKKGFFYTRFYRTEHNSSCTLSTTKDSSQRGQPIWILRWIPRRSSTKSRSKLERRFP